ncbi:hypothetical protein QUF72_01510 [Desulfobacterales bacterium HSG2]|nr:hypothetical protein [Desulfobacterales bacterium HSG2]
MRILYVEDQLEENIPKVIRLFSKYLGKELIEKLNDLEEEDYKEPEEVKEIVESTNLIEVEYRFPDALRKIRNPEKYSLFIVDRNLVEGSYKFDEVRKIDGSYDEGKFEKFSKANREGDYLLHQLILVHKVEVSRKFYFLTAYSVKDELRGYEDIENYIVMGQFAEKNFIQKDNNEDVERLKRIIDNNDQLNLMHENMPYLHILNKHIDAEIAEIFFTILDTKSEEGRIRDNLNRIRIVYENILTVCSNVIPDMKKECGNEKGGSTVLWLKDEKHIDDIILRNFLFGIRKIANEFGSHKAYPYNPIYEPTLDTISSVVYALKDVISWFDGICSRYP